MVILAQEFDYDDDGRPRPDRSMFYVPNDYVLAYKWLNLAAARTGGRQRDAYLRFRDAVALKLSRNEIVAGQRFALGWVPGRPVPDVHLTVK